MIGTHINHYADITQYVSRVLCKHSPYTWIDKEQKLFEEIKKNCLQRLTILIYPDWGMDYSFLQMLSNTAGKQPFPSSMWPKITRGSKTH